MKTLLLSNWFEKNIVLLFLMKIIIKDAVPQNQQWLQTSLPVIIINHTVCRRNVMYFYLTCVIPVSLEFLIV